MHILDLPTEVSDEIIHQVVVSRGIKRGLRLRLVNSTFARVVIQVLFTFRLLDDAHEVAGKVHLTSLLYRYVAYRAKNEPLNGNPLLCCLRRVALDVIGTREVQGRDIEFLGSSPVDKFCAFWGRTSNIMRLEEVFQRKEEVSEDEYRQTVFATALCIDDLALAQSCIESDSQFLSKLGSMSASNALRGRYRILAARHGSVEMLEYLLVVTAGTSKVDKRLRRELFKTAARCGRTNVVKFLYDFKREEVPWDFGDWWSDDCNMLRHAQTTSSLQLLVFVPGLLRTYLSKTYFGGIERQGALAKATIDNRLDTTVYIIHRGPNAPVVNHIGLINGFNQGLIQCAAQAGNVAVAEHLIHHGADPKLAIFAASGHGQTEFVKVMLAAKQPTGLAMAKAAACGHWDIVRLLLDAGDDVNKTPGKNSPLVHAIAREHAAMFKLLVERGADLHLDGTAQECVQRAHNDGLDSMLVLLAEHGVDVNKGG
ncbi:ankyrin [Lophiostoma macrostomum CBS 122681]|uniref:Ankyrin n=1 Tax=Lophiostoma macrostomum CBS 122681 TaxID=1314788 RepID=A0A6A6SQ90_9PLEO|nr:ankyrin [Lophiostoma macrostomum CBS 122681]